MGLGHRLQLDNAHPEHETTNGKPLFLVQLLTKQEHHEEGSGDDFELVTHLKDGRVQVGEGEEKQIVLKGVEGGRHEHGKEIVLGGKDMLLHDLS